MKKNFKKLAILSMAAFLFLASRQASAMQKQETPLDTNCITIVSKYFDKANDYVNLAKTCKHYDVTGLIHRNFISLSRNELKIFPSIQTYYVESRFDPILPVFTTPMSENITRIIYKAKAVTFAAIDYMIESGKKLGITPSIIRADNLQSTSDFNIVFDFKARNRTIELEVRRAELGDESYNSIKKLLKENFGIRL